MSAKFNLINKNSGLGKIKRDTKWFKKTTGYALENIKFIFDWKNSKWKYIWDIKISNYIFKIIFLHK